MRHTEESAARWYVMPARAARTAALEAVSLAARLLVLPPWSHTESTTAPRRARHKRA